MRPGTRVFIVEDDPSLARLVELEHRVLAREAKLESVWRQDFCAETNVVDVYLVYLRKRLGAGEGDRLIRTVRGAVRS